MDNVENTSQSIYNPLFTTKLREVTNNGVYFDNAKFHYREKIVPEFGGACGVALRPARTPKFWIFLAKLVLSNYSGQTRDSPIFSSKRLTITQESKRTENLRPLALSA